MDPPLNAGEKKLKNNLSFIFEKHSTRENYKRLFLNKKRIQKKKKTRYTRRD